MLILQRQCHYFSFDLLYVKCISSIHKVLEYLAVVSRYRQYIANFLTLSTTDSLVWAIFSCENQKCSQTLLNLFRDPNPSWLKNTLIEDRRVQGRKSFQECRGRAFKPVRPDSNFTLITVLAFIPLRFPLP